MGSFADYGIQVRAGATGNHKTLCPQCSHTRRKNRHEKCLSVHVEGGKWHCHHCSWSGGLGSGKPGASMKPVLQALEERSYRKPEPPKASGLSQRHINELVGRGISSEVAEQEGVYTSEKGNMSFPCMKDGELVNIKYRGSNKFFSQSGGGMPVLWRYDKCMEMVKNGERLIVCEGEYDVLTLLQCGVTCVTTIPCGAEEKAETLPDDTKKFDFLFNSKPLIDAAKEIVLFMDDDHAGRPMQKELARRIGKEKCLFIPDYFGYNDPNQMLEFESADFIREIVSSAKHYPISGVTTYRDFADTILSYNPNDCGGISTGYPLLDNYFRIIPGDLCVMVGIPESGKSEFCDQLIINSICDEGWKWTYYTPENMPPQRHFVRVAEKLHRVPFSAMTDEQKMDAVNRMSDHVFLINPEEGIDVDGMLDKIDALVYRHGINGFILDPWNEIDHARSESLPEHEYIGIFLQKCRNFARKRDIFFLIVAHPTKMSQGKDGEYTVPTPYHINGSAGWYNKPDICLSLWRSFVAQAGPVELHIQKMRSKYAGKRGMVEFKFDINTGTYSPIVPL